VAVHAESPSLADTDWAEIVGLYDVLLQVSPSPVVELNRAVAVAMRDGPAEGLALVDALAARGELKTTVCFTRSARTSAVGSPATTRPARRTRAR
jgi:RNA polymerase sigma-70 factor (ECF subfamily)